MVVLTIKNEEGVYQGEVLDNIKNGYNNRS